MKYLSIVLMILIGIIKTDAQFYTIQKKNNPGYIIMEEKKEPEEKVNKVDSLVLDDSYETEIKREAFRFARKKAPRTKGKIELTYSYKPSFKLEGLTIKKLYQEILDNNILHPKIVLAQAILETGWFKSSVCRNKGNLFGLTNPRTGQYYEFDHWKESVKAYRDKVQYKYKGGNYLLWLREIGYAEDPRYVSSLIKILEQHFL